MDSFKLALVAAAPSRSQKKPEECFVDVITSTNAQTGVPIATCCDAMLCARRCSAGYGWHARALANRTAHHQHCSRWKLRPDPCYLYTGNLCMKCSACIYERDRRGSQATTVPYLCTLTQQPSCISYTRTVTAQHCLQVEVRQQKVCGALISLHERFRATYQRESGHCACGLDTRSQASHVITRSCNRR